METSTELAVVPQPAALVTYTVQDLGELAERILGTEFVPKQFKTVNSMVVAMQHGVEVGLKPLQSLRSIAVINGVPSLWGAGCLAIIKSSPICEYVMTSFESDTMTAVVRSKRVGDPEEQIYRYSLEDAKIAGNANKDTYKKHPKDMLTWKALARCAKMSFADVMMGIEVREDAHDFPVDNTDASISGINAEIRANRAKVGATQPVAEDANVTDAEYVEHTEVVEAKDEEVNTEETAPENESDELAVVRKLFESFGMGSEIGMDRVCAMVLNKESPRLVKLSTDDLSRVSNGVKYIGVQTGSERFAPFVSYCGMHSLLLNTKVNVTGSLEKYKESQAANG